MEYPEDAVLASRYVKQAIPLMVKHGIPPNPCNFALWYAYVANRDTNLKHALNKAIADDGGYSEELSRELFLKHIIKDEAELAGRLQSSLKSIMQDLVQNIEHAINGTHDYRNALHNGLRALESSLHAQGIEETLRRLISNTDTASALTENFQHRLNSAEQEVAALREQLQRSQRDLYLDPLTQIGNRRAFDRALVALTQQRDEPTSMMLIDLDHFKQFNDTYGHVMGDRVLQGVAEALRSLCPAAAHLSRYGGEEFAILLTDDLTEACAVAHKVRLKLSKLKIKRKNSGQIIGNITASIGVAQLQSGEYPEQLVERVDSALYTAKHKGRDQIVTATYALSA